jgi:hypothetical protein
MIGCGGGGDATSSPSEPVIENVIPKPLDLMSYGITTLTADGQLAVSSEAPALHLIGKADYSGVVTQSGVQGTFQRYVINVAEGVPLPIFRMTPGDGIWIESPIVRWVGGTQWELLVRTNKAAGSVEIFCFGKVPLGAAPADAWGYRVFGPGNTGVVQFDSTRMPLQIASIVTLPHVPRNTPPMPANGSIGTFWDSTPADLPNYPGIFIGVSGYVSGGSTIKAPALRLNPGAVERVVGSWWGGNVIDVNPTSAGLYRAETLIVDLTPYL